MAQFNSILAGTDFSSTSNRVIDLAVAMCKDSGAMLHIVHVIDTPEFPVTLANYDDITEVLEQHARQNTDKLRLQLDTAGIQYTIAVKQGVPSVNLLEYAAANGIDLICVGIHGHSKLENFLFGSTTERLLRKAECPVLTVRC